MRSNPVMLLVAVTALLFGVCNGVHSAMMGKRDRTPTMVTLVDGPDPSDQSDPTFWWAYSNQDCAYDDVTTANCTGQSVDQCKALCLQTPNCGAFNSHGYLKLKDCLTKKADCPGCDVTLYVIESTPQPPPPPPAWIGAWPPIVPHPSHYYNGSQTVAIDRNVALSFTNGSSPDITAAFDRFVTRTFSRRQRASALEDTGAIIKVVVQVDNAYADVQLNIDESYTLNVLDHAGQVTIMASTQAGVMHALETLSQLIRFDATTEMYFIAGAPWIITDEPRFPHRELLLDTSRHYQPMRSLMYMIDSMTYAKLNVLHWHIVDHQSFPFRAPSRPALADKGAYSPYERYTIQDVEDIVEFARARAIRVVVEVDMPGHAMSWCAGFPEVCPTTTCLQPLNPMTNATFELIDDLLGDLTGGKRGAGPFFDDFLHLGGDEVDTGCWSNTPEIAAWMKNQSMSTGDTFLYFLNKAHAIGRSKGRDIVGWEEVWNSFGTKLDRSTIIQIWLSANTAKSVVENGYRCIFSPYPVWYLDYLNQDWKINYAVEPCNGIEDNVCDAFMLGGGGEMWGERVDGSDVQPTVWPRLAAIAERLWSPRNINDTVKAEPRLQVFRCLLNERGVAAAPLTNPNARDAPSGPGGCYFQ